MTAFASRYAREKSAEQYIYEHLIELVKVESPQQLIDRFRRLFVEGSGYPDSDIVKALDKITTSKTAEEEFNSVLNRSCHILINHWQMEAKAQGSIPELVRVFDQQGRRSYSSQARRLSGLIQQFKQSEEYLTLHRLLQVVDRETEPEDPGSRPLGTLIGRYPYLYAHSLLSDSSSYEHQQTVRKIQAQRQRQYEIDLSRYVTYKVRRAQLTRARDAATADRVLNVVPNPTLLNDRELYVAVKQFAGKAERSSTYRDLAHNFVTHSSQTRTFAGFKDDLYEYLITSIDPEYGKRQFNDRLYNHLKNTLPQSDDRQPSEFLVLRTCSQLLNFLVVESSQNPNHFVLIDLISNIGPTLVMVLLLKIILICRKVKPYLEKRFAILFDHYDDRAREAVIWLIKALENMNVALSTNFGAADLSFLTKGS